MASLEACRNNEPTDEPRITASRAPNPEPPIPSPESRAPSPEPRIPSPDPRLLGDALAECDYADRADRPAGRRRFEAALRHQLPDQRGGFGPLDRRLYADTHEAFGVIERLPRD